MKKCLILKHPPRGKPLRRGFLLRIKIYLMRGQAVFLSKDDEVCYFDPGVLIPLCPGEGILKYL